MDIKTVRSEIIKHYYPVTTIVIITVLGIVGMIMIYFSGIFSVENINMLYQCIAINGILIIVGGFFFCISLGAWITFFLNIMLPLKREVLYLIKKENNEFFFIDKKGRRFDFILNNNYIEENNYYCVLKTYSFIYEVLGKTSDNWVPKEKRSYWTNYYSPVGNFENILLLPIAYLLLLIILLGLFVSKGYEKIYCIIIIIVPLYFIVYDLLYKIKLKQNDYKEIDETNFLNSYCILKKSFLIITVIIMCGITSIIFFSCSDLISKLMFLPFYLCSLCSVGLVISKFFNNNKLNKIFYNGYLIIFLIYWFGIIYFGTIYTLKNGINLVNLILLVLFLLIGMYMVYSYFIKKDK